MTYEIIALSRLIVDSNPGPLPRSSLIPTI